MLEIIIGIVAGIFSGIGMGGGTILILILSVFLGIEQHVAQATNLIFFIFTSISAISISSKNKLINWKIGIKVAMFGIIGSIIGSKISIKMEVNKLKKLFGLFLLIIAVYEIYLLIKEYKKEKSINNKLK